MLSLLLGGYGLFLSFVLEGLWGGIIERRMGLGLGSEIESEMLIVVGDIGLMGLDRGFRRQRFGSGGLVSSFWASLSEPCLLIFARDRF